MKIADAALVVASGPAVMSHEDVKLEAWQAAVSPKLDCCTEPTLKASGLTVGSLVVYVKRQCSS